VLSGAGATARVKSALLELLPESLKLIFQLGSFFPQIADFVSPSPLDRSGDQWFGPRAGAAVKQIVRGFQVTSHEDSCHNRQHALTSIY
jgi:hypothetical protein